MMKIQAENRRQYTKKSEFARQTDLRDIETKDHNYYNRTQNLWNSPKHLKPEINKYSAHENTFKPHPIDLEKVQNQERQSSITASKLKVLKTKDAIHERYNARRMERMVQQFSCSQGLTDREIETISKLENEDPQLYDDMHSQKRKTYVAKNTDKAIRQDCTMNKYYWNLMNHMPEQQVKNIVIWRWEGERRSG